MGSHEDELRRAVRRLFCGGVRCIFAYCGHSRKTQFDLSASEQALSLFILFCGGFYEDELRHAHLIIKSAIISINAMLLIVSVQIDVTCTQRMLQRCTILTSEHMTPVKQKTMHAINIIPYNTVYII